MDWSIFLLVVYCSLIVIASMVGGWIPSRVRLSHTRMQMIMSFVAGLMLGVALLHLLPHAAHQFAHAGGSIEWAFGSALIGLLAMFFLIRTFHFHQHGPADDSEHGEACHDHHHEHHEEHNSHGEHRSNDFSWAGLAVGLAVHTLLDGVALGGAVAAEAANEWTISFAIFLAIVLHKPLDALSITSLMAVRGWSTTQQTLVNAGFATMVPLGAILFSFSLEQFDQTQIALGCALAFSAGVFLCISLGDLLPEVHFHQHDRLKLSAMLLAGVLVAYVIELSHTHDHTVPNGDHVPAEKHSHSNGHSHDHDDH